MSGSNGKKVVVAMSGGVDSSVAAAMLLREGYEVVGVFMRLGSPQGVEAEEAQGGVSCEMEGEAAGGAAKGGAAARGGATVAGEGSGKSKQGCCSVLDAADARRVAGVLGVGFYVLNFQDEFDRVINYFVDEYNRGRTPNPCVRCNDWLKFGKLAKYAEAVGADYVASGHYARVGVEAVSGRKGLRRGLDHRKDQSYVLFGMSPATLEHSLFPIGEMEKSRVRAIAEEMKLPVFNKPDSQEICFVPNQDYAGLVKRRAGEQFHKGEIVTSGGEVVGEHEGHQHFTIGQRRGVGVAFGYPIYVVDIDPAANRVTVGQREELLRRGLRASQLNILNPRLSAAAGAVRVRAKIRYNHQPQAGFATVLGEDELSVTFDEPQAAITPGQAVVLYDEDDFVLGGGWIDRATD